MITTRTARPSRSADGAAWRCLARRGMLHSECEAVDHLVLAPGAERDGRGRAGVEAAWFVVRGEGRFHDAPDHWVPLRPGDLVLWRGGAGGSLRADSELELVALAVLPAGVTDRLPARVPVFEGAGRG
ncbi:cupin domain-containing protein [Actinokineospora sp. PR83]|uniref:cupin domain-containing protein n=1 Tax=Actinokineospora sp. PR83 TaxID=2884908 RepID=UPI0027E0C9C6|nr:cupin domain-containing protein [Actinokineospora sp. PR83]MCG8915758.1 cupin domain-containing protein [Actinokineospora sp. PR83]